MLSFSTWLASDAAAVIFTVVLAIFALIVIVTVAMSIRSDYKFRQFERALLRNRIRELENQLNQYKIMLVNLQIKTQKDNKYEQK